MSSLIEVDWVADQTIYVCVRAWVGLAIENGVRRIEATFGKSMKAFGLSAGVTSWIEAVVREGHQGQGDQK